MLDSAERKKTLKELVENEKLKRGDIIPFKLNRVAYYVSKNNGYGNQKFNTTEIENSSLIYLGEEEGGIKTVLYEPFGNLVLYGKKGYENGIKELDKVAKALFSNQTGVVSARSCNKEDAENLRYIDLEKMINTPYWIATSYSSYAGYSKRNMRGLYCMNSNNELYKEELYFNDYLYVSNFRVNNRVRSIIYLNPDITIDELTENQPIKN